MVFITAGMGGGTGTGGGPVVARAAREQGILTVGVVTKPFQFEGVHRMRIAEAGLTELQQYVDTLIIIPNQNLFRVANEKTTFADAFKMADDVLYSGVRGVTDLMVMPGLINLDFADVRAVMAEMGKAMMGTGEAEGENRAVVAAEAAISNPLLDDISMEGARGVLINITGGYDMTLFEVDAAANRIRDEVDPEANIIFGSTFDESLDGRMRVSVVSTGIEVNGEVRPRPVIAVVETPDEPAVEEPVLDEATGEVAEEAAADALAGEVAVEPVDPAPEPEPEPVEEPPVMQPVDELVRELAAATAATASEPAPALEMAGDAPPADHGFIPPPPVMPGSKATLSDNADPFAAAAMSNGAKAAAPKRARAGLSLFERMTGTGRARHTSPAPKFGSAAKRQPEFEPAAEPALTASEPPPEPPRDAPLPKVEEDVLDIPAFLRRQSN
jgi:cell division protein FtsZ